MSNKIYVGSLSWNTNSETLKTAFQAYGEVTEANVIVDRDSGRSRGFGFVTFADSESAQSAITEMDGKDLDGRTIKVSFAKENSNRDRGGSGGGRPRTGGSGGGGGGFSRG